MCDADPRTIDQRRAHAIAARSTTPPSSAPADSPTAPAAPPVMRPATNAVVYVVADEESVDAATAAQESDADPPRPPLSRRAPRRSRPTCSAPESCRPHCWAASWSGHASARSATPARARTPEPRYTPSRRLAEFVRCRDSDVPVPWLRQTRPGLRHRPHRGLPGRPDAPVEPEVPVPFSPFAENVLERAGRLAGPTTTRRHHHLDQPDRTHLRHLPRQPAPVPATV